MNKLCLSCAAVLGLALAVPSAHAHIFDFSAHSVKTSSLMVKVSGVESGAEGFITKLADQGVGFLGDTNLSQSKQKSEFKKLLNTNFDMNTIARFSLGRHWRSASKAQQQEYLKLFNAMIVDVYSARFKDYQGQKIKVTGSRKEGERDVLVHSTMEQQSGPDVKIDWRVRQKSGQYRVVDVIVEGVSMALTQRSDFSSVIQRGGGDMEALLAPLRK